MSKDSGHPRSIADFLLVFAVSGAIAGAALPACSGDEVGEPPPGNTPDAGVTTGSGGSGTTGTGGSTAGTGGATTGGQGGSGGSTTTGTGGATSGGAGGATGGAAGTSGGAGGATGGTAGAAGSGGTTGGAGGGSADGGTPDASTIPPPHPSGIKIPPSTQKPGDPAKGYEYLTNAGYFGCGLPERFFTIAAPFATLPGSG
ncbi:MAG: hypothetical protein ABW133_04190, partial [Polyangiaceae bacterium]